MIDVPDTIRQMIDRGAIFALNDSGGKDSQAMRIIVREVVPKEQTVVIHASLGEVEWPGALEHAQAGAERDGFPFIVAHARKTFLEMVERRSTTRTDAPCWPSASNRQCTSDLKRDPIARELRALLLRRGVSSIVSCMGIRSEESASRAKAVTLGQNKRNSLAGRDWWDWLPIHSLTRAQVLQTIADAGEQLHPAYGMGNERLSCMFCIMGSRNDLRNAALRNPSMYRKYVEIERRTGYTMHQSRLSLPQLTGVSIDGVAANVPELAVKKKSRRAS